MELEIKHKKEAKSGKFFVEINEKIVGEMTYVWEGKDEIIIEHTIVDDALKGQGAGKKLLAVAVDFARAEHIKIVPECSFVKSVFEKMPEYQDVLK